MAAFRAKEVGVGRCVGIKAAISFVDGKLQRGSFVGENLQRVVHGCLRKGGHGGLQGTINFIGSGMRTMIEQIFHYCHALQ